MDLAVRRLFRRYMPYGQPNHKRGADIRRSVAGRFLCLEQAQVGFRPDQVLCELIYMRKEEIIPIGWGKYIDKK